MSNEKLVWYASYGSNAFRDRFHCYVRGGKIKGNIREYEGCTDPSLPLDEKNIIIPHRLYFAKSSISWSKGGVGFITQRKTETDKTYGRMYLITEAQFADVVKQETRRKEKVLIDFEAVKESGHLHILNNVWYGRILHLGSEGDHPIFTFTSAADQTDINPPSPDYLKTLIKGLKTNFEHTRKEVVDYLRDKQGIRGFYEENDLEKLLAETEDELEVP